MAGFIKYDYESITARTIVIPELGRSLVISNLDASAISEGEITPEMVDQLLLEGTRNFLRVADTSVLTSSQWLRIGNEVSSIITSEDFRSEMRSVVAGSDPAKKAKFDSWLKTSNATMKLRTEELGNPVGFAEVMIRKVLLDPRGAFGRQPPGFLDYAGNPSLIQSVYADLSSKGIGDLELFRWQQMTYALGRSILPAMKSAYEELQGYEVALAGSKALKLLTLEQFIKGCRGAAFVVMGDAAVQASIGLNGDWHALAALVVKGGLVSLSFISVGQLAQVIEKGLFAKQMSIRKPRDSGQTK
jgi:hypothetical protein